MNTAHLLLETTASIQSQGMALSEWVDSQPEPWTMVLRFLPVTGAFLLGLILVLLWKRKPVPVGSEETEERLPSLEKELEASLEKNKSQKDRIATAGRELETKDQELDKLRSQLSAVETVDKVAVEALPAKVTPTGDTEMEPREDLQDFAVASEKLAEAASQFREKIRAEADKKGADIIDSSQSESPPDWEELVLFRSNDPSMWNQSVDDGEDRHAVSLAQAPDTATFLRLRRLDTGEGVVVPVRVRDLTQDGGEHSTGFNGSNEEFYGARHLGIYNEGLPQEVETRFAYGGWGFGHRVNGETTQALGWAGREISGETVIEITVFPRLPKMSTEDQLLGTF